MSKTYIPQKGFGDQLAQLREENKNLKEALAVEMLTRRYMGDENERLKGALLRIKIAAEKPWLGATKDWAAHIVREAQAALDGEI